MAPRKKSVEKVGEHKGPYKKVICRRCSTDKETVEMKATTGGSRGMFTWYKCDGCKGTVKIQRGTNPVFMVNPQSKGVAKDKPVEDGSEA